MSRLKHQLPEYILLTIYQTLIAPHLNHAITCWGDSPQSTVKRLMILQKKALRIVANSRYNSHCDPLFKKFRILKLGDLYKFHCVRLPYKNKLSLLPQYHSDKLLLTRNIQNMRTRQTHNIFIINHIDY